MEQLFYRPEDGVAADFIPFYYDGEFRLFYLKDYRDVQNHGEGTPWFQITTRDFVQFRELGEMIPRGNAAQQDLYVYTGSILQAQGQFHIFYTGHNPYYIAEGKPQEAVMHAVSDDLVHWRKVAEDTFYADPQSYEPHDFRDPFVFYDEQSGTYFMLLVARKKDCGYTAGFTALYSSADLKHWKDEGDFWAPNLYHTHECPDLFRMGDWWYLIFSEYSDRYVTHYLMSKSPKGPWVMPADDVFDGRAFYAAKSCADENARYLFGWIPTKENGDDNGNWMWGGNLAVHELVQNEDGTLRCKLPETIAKVWDAKKRLSAPACVSQPYGKGEQRLFANLPCTYRMDAVLKFQSGTKQFGISFGQSFETKHGYKYEFFPHENRLKFNAVTASINTKEVSRFIELEAGKEIHITLLVDGEICVFYVNDTVALSARMYQKGGNDLSLFAVGGAAEVKSAVVSY